MQLQVKQFNEVQQIQIDNQVQVSETGKVVQPMCKQVREDKAKTKTGNNVGQNQNDKPN